MIFQLLTGIRRTRSRPSHTTGHEFPTAFSAYWVHFISDEDTTAQLD